MTASIQYRLSQQGRGAPLWRPTAAALVIWDHSGALPLPTTRTVIIGRDCNAATLDLTPFQARTLGVSRQHAQIKPLTAGLHIADLSSTNGTFLNGHRLQPKHYYLLHEGDELKLGELYLTIYNMSNG